MDIIISQIKIELIEHYGIMTSDIDIKAQTILSQNAGNLTNKNISNERFHEIYKDIIDIVKKTLDESMSQLNDFVKSESNLQSLISLSKDEIKRKILTRSCLFICNDHLKKDFKFENENIIGLLVICDWFLSENQCKYLKYQLHQTKYPLIKLCFDQDLLDIYKTLPVLYSEKEISFTRKILLSKANFYIDKHQIVKMNDGNIVSIESKSFNNLTKFQIVDLFNNRIGDIRRNCFGEFNNMIELNLNGCEIKTIEAFAFENLHSLEKLDLGFNPMKILKEHTFQGLESLRLLLLNFCQVESIETNCFFDLKKLEKLELSENKLKKLGSNSFDHLTNLTSLCLADNQIETFEGDPFDCLKSLKRLFISNNPIILNENGQLMEKIDFKVKFGLNNKKVILKEWHFNK